MSKLDAIIAHVVDANALQHHKFTFSDRGQKTQRKAQHTAAEFLGSIPAFALSSHFPESPNVLIMKTLVEMQLRQPSLSGRSASPRTSTSSIHI
jgi:hypothetical protein